MNAEKNKCWEILKVWQLATYSYIDHRDGVEFSHKINDLGMTLITLYSLDWQQYFGMPMGTFEQWSTRFKDFLEV